MDFPQTCRGLSRLGNPVAIAVQGLFLLTVLAGAAEGWSLAPVSMRSIGGLGRRAAISRWARGPEQGNALSYRMAAKENEEKPIAIEDDGDEFSALALPMVREGRERVGMPPCVEQHPDCHAMCTIGQA